MDEAILRKRLVDLGLVKAEKLNSLIASRPEGDQRSLATLVVEAGLFTKNDLVLLTGSADESNPDDKTRVSWEGDGRTLAAENGKGGASNGATKPTAKTIKIWPPPTPISPTCASRVKVREMVREALAEDPLFAPHAELTLVRERTLGKGGMGVVFLVNDQRLGRLAALKLMREDGNEVAIQRFLREAAITSRLDHPGIPPVYEAGRTAGGQHFMLMRYVAGESLAQILAHPGGPKLELRELLGILAKVGDAVAYSHSKRIVHRDLKPSNIMVGSFGEVLVMDWGLARNIEETESMDAAIRENRMPGGDSVSDAVTRAGAILGTLGYMSPEQARGEDVDGRSDTFSLGAILVEVLTGKPPITGDSVADLVKTTSDARVTLPRQRVPTVEPELDAIATKALQAKGKDRYSSAKTFADDLRAFLEGRRVTAYRYPISEKLRRFVRAHSTFFATLTVALLLSAIALAILARTNAELGEVKSERDTAVQRDENQVRAHNLFDEARNRFRQGAPLPEVRRLALEAAAAHRSALLEAGLLLAEAGDPDAARGLLEACAAEFPPAYAALFALHDIEGGSAGAFRCGPALKELLERARKRGEENEFTALAQCADAIERGEWERARECASRAVAQAPRLGAAFIYRAEVELHAGELQSALQDAEKAVAATPGSPAALDERARVRIASGDLDGALDDTRRAIAAVASDGVAFAQKSRVELARKQLDAAIADATRGTELAPSWAPAWADLSAALLVHGDAKRAIEHATRALELDRHLAHAWSTRAAARLVLGDLPEAIADATGAIDRDPRAAPAWATRARARLLQGDWAHTVEDATRATELDPRNAQALAAKAAAHLARGELDPAIQSATRALEIDPRDAASCAVRAAANRRKGALDAAIADATQALELDPSLAEAWTDRARARLGRRELDLALSDANEAVTRAPRLLDGWLARSDIRRARLDLEGAVSDAAHAIELDAKSARGWVTRADARLARDELVGAIADAQRSLELDPGLARAWATRGAARLAKGELEGAVTDLSKAIELDAALEAAWAARAQARLKKGDAPGAIADEERRVVLAPRSPLAWLDLATLRIASGDLDGAIGDYGHALELDRKDARTWVRRARARQQKGDLDGAIDDFGKALDLEPRNARTWNERGYARIQRGDLDAAFTDLDRALALEPKADAWTNHGDAWRRKGDLDRAMQDVDTAIRLDPRYASAWLVRGLIKWGRDDHEGAAADYSTALKLDARLLPAWISRGEARQALGNVDGAIDDWTHAVAIDPRAAAEAFRLRGLARAIRGEDNAASDDLTRYLALAPGSPWTTVVRNRLAALKAREK